MYASPSRPPARKSMCEWRYKGLAGEILKWISWGSFGVCYVAFPASTVSSSNSSVFLWELSPFYLHDLDWVAPPTSRTLAHPHSQPMTLRLFQERICNLSQVEETLHPDFVIIVGKRCFLSVGAAKI